MRDLRAAIRNQPPAEHAFDRDPIHMPGSVQAYGVLLVVEPSTRRIQFVSANAASLLGIAPADLLDKTYLALTDSDTERKFLKDRIAPGTILFPNPVRLTIKGRPFDAVFHAQGAQHLIEIEPVLDEADSYSDMSLRATAELYDPPTVDSLFQRSVQVIREVSGFDRVMLYCFDSRYNGQVIAEAGRDGIGSFLGLFFPSGDITARAREMYLSNFTRYIPDIQGQTFGCDGIFPGNGTADSAHPIDMSTTNLRSVVPCHVTYLRNIGVRASMSFSINVDGRLWGLFACHHYAPRHISYEKRVVCEQTAMMFIYRLAVMSSSAARLAERRKGVIALTEAAAAGTALRRRLSALQQEWHGTPANATITAMLARAIEAIQAESCLLLPLDDLPDNQPSPQQVDLSDAQKLLLALTESDSAAIVHHGRVQRIGAAPSEMAIYAIASMFGRELPDLRSGDLHVYATDCLSAVVPAAQDIKASAAGIMAAALSLESPSVVIWFRCEQIVQATWAGNPSADALAAGSDGANPRASFAAWQQDIRNLSRPWVLEDIEVADELSAAVRSLDHGSSDAEQLHPTGLPSPKVATLRASDVGPGGSPKSPMHRGVIRIGRQ